MPFISGGVICPYFYQGESSLFHVKDYYEVDLDNEIVEKEKKEKKTWDFD